jgi:hypothetical protein
MRTLFAAALLSLSMFACKPPVTEVQIPLVSSMQGKGYQEVVPLTEIKISQGAEIVTAYLITPEMSIINATERLQAAGNGDQIEAYKTRELQKDTVVSQLRFMSVNKASADPTAWKFTVTDEKGKKQEGTIIEGTMTPSRPVRTASGNLNYTQDAQIRFDGYKIADAKKITVTLTSKSGKAMKFNWLMPADHIIPIPAASQPTSAPQ